MLQCGASLALRNYFQCLCPQEVLLGFLSSSQEVWLILGPALQLEVLRCLENLKAYPLKDVSSHEPRVFERMQESKPSVLRHRWVDTSALLTNT